MSSKHRHGLPRKRPVNKRRQEIEDQLPASAAGAKAAKPAGGRAVVVTCAASEEDGLDTVLTIEVPEMEKQAVAGAISAPLAAAATEHRAAIRFRKVAVRFAGDALIGSAVRDLVAEQLAVASPVKVVVRRGYGDETVFQGEAPKLAVAASVEGVDTVVGIGTAGFEAEDLPAFFAPHLAELAGGAAGKRFVLRFEGDARPSRDLRESIASTLREAGAARVAIGARVFFDRELTDRCQVADGDDVVQVTIDPAVDPAITGEAMELVLPDHALGFAGRVVRVLWKQGPEHGEGDHFLRIVTGFAPERVEFVETGGAAEVVWPAVLELVAGKPVLLRVRPNGRERPAVLAAFPVEVADLEEELKDKPVVVDWPKLFVIDDEAERCLVDALTRVGAASVCCTISGEDREPFLPPPVTTNDDGEFCRVLVDTDAGRPAELVRAAARALPRVTAHFAGKPVRVVITGGAPASRTLLRTVLDHIVTAGPTRLEVEDHGPVDVYLPPMLAVTRSGEREARIEVDLGGRGEDQRAPALRREFEAMELPKGAVVTLVPSPLDADLLALLVEHHAACVTLADGTQLHPEVLPEPEPEPEVVAAAEPEPEPAPAAPEPVAPAPAVAEAVTGGAIRVLAHNNEGVPPTVLLGIEVGSDAAHLAAVEQELGANLPKLRSRAVMVVLQQNGQDVPVRRSDDMVAMLQRTLPAGAAASLIFRGPDAQGRPHFQVLHSTLRAMPVGATFRDPRA